jgi:uncharacterized protein YcbK (DUF882 family)
MGLFDIFKRNKNVEVRKAIPLTNEEQFQRELDKRKVKNFTAKEVFFKGASNARLKLNTEPPKELWDNIYNTLIVADKARNKFGKPLKIVSAYRSPKYNKAIGGEKKSHHMKFNALDLRTSAPRTLHKILLEMRNKGEFKGGLGLYKTFVHVDTRGYNADWRG